MKLAAEFKVQDEQFIPIENQNGDNFKFSLVSMNFVHKQIKLMKSDKATGIDGISVRLLKSACPIILHSLTHLFNLSLTTHTFPDKWKVAKVSPIYKSGDKEDIGNYRPISVLPIVSKFIERAVHDQLYLFLQGKNIMTKEHAVWF